MNRVTNITNTIISELSLEHCGTLQMVQLAEDSAVYMKAMVVQAEYNKEKDAYRELLFLTFSPFRRLLGRVVSCCVSCLF